MYDSDPPPLGAELVRDAQSLLPGGAWGDTCIARALAPPETNRRTVQEYYLARTLRLHDEAHRKPPEWLDLYDATETEILDFEPAGDNVPMKVGGLLCSFEIRSMQEVKAEEQARTEERGIKEGVMLFV